ncbi:hypothetical protein DY000_02052131 [Brassica cretica]|uniref:Uncharacterized protein n=1 Tax=Brassica cretica TaxID=69181 RepID=A0ABQ7A9A6_BRACR|nr:hypothetical protein DY000_02052131 [Brassica cretica]
MRQLDDARMKLGQMGEARTSSAGSAGSQLNSAGWSVGSSDQCVSSRRLPGRLVGQGWLWAGGFFWSGHGHGQSVWACFGHFQEWFDSSKESGFLYVLGTHANGQERREKTGIHSQWHEQSQRRMQCRKWFHGSSMEGMMGATHEWILSILESVGSDLMALNQGIGRFRNDAHGLSPAVHGQDPYDPGTPNYQDASVEDAEARPLQTYLKDLVGRTYTFKLKLFEFKFSSSKYQSLTTARTFDDNELQPMPNFVEHEPWRWSCEHLKTSHGATREAPKTNGGIDVVDG